MLKGTIVNGYKIPGAGGGVMVMKACELVCQNPGITQKDLLNQAVEFSGLNHSTATWLTSPGPKSPAEKLWERRKEGVFKCYPIEGVTNLVHGSQIALNDERMDNCLRLAREWKYIPTPGDIVEVDNGYSPIWGGRVSAWAWSAGSFKDAHIFNSFNELKAARPHSTPGSTAFVWITDSKTDRSEPEWMINYLRKI